MNTSALPPIFVSHGSPMIALEPGAAGAFLGKLGPAIDAAFGRPKAILAISAHTSARAPAPGRGSRTGGSALITESFMRETYTSCPPRDPARSFVPIGVGKRLEHDAAALVL